RGGTARGCRAAPAPLRARGGGTRRRSRRVRRPPAPAGAVPAGPVRPPWDPLPHLAGTPVRRHTPPGHRRPPRGRGLRGRGRALRGGPRRAPGGDRSVPLVT